jgi:protein arginine kinase activator
MTCQDCNQEEAAVVFTQIKGDTKQVFHLCKACADKRCGLAGGQTTEDTGCSEAKVVWPLESGDADLVCSACGRSLAEFKQRGRFGCAACYGAFADRLGSIMKRIHGADRHRPDGPESCVSEQERMAALKESLREAVAHEAFEEAAKLRDQIEKMTP